MRFRWFFCVFVHCCVSLRVYECFCAFLRVFVPFGCSWSLLGRSWAFLEGSWGALGAILEQSWTLWVTLGTPLGRSWGHDGRILQKMLRALPKNGPNLGGKNLPNSLKIDVEKQHILKHVFAIIFCNF